MENRGHLHQHKYVMCWSSYTPYLHVCNQPKMKCRVILAFGGGGSGGSCHSGSGSSDGSSVHNSVLLKSEIETCRGRCSDHAGAALFRQPPCANESSDSCGTNALRTTNSQSRVHDWFVSQPAQGGHSDWIRDLAWYYEPSPWYELVFKKFFMKFHKNFDHNHLLNFSFFFFRMNPQSLLAVERRVTLHRTVGASWGLSLTCEGTKHVVEEIVEGSPGQKAGVLTGDNIIVSFFCKNTPKSNI